jgi:hypothetical protein
MVYRVSRFPAIWSWAVRAALKAVSQAMELHDIFMEDKDLPIPLKL